MFTKNHGFLNMGDVKNADCMDKRINREGKAVVDYKPIWCTFQSELGI